MDGLTPKGSNLNPGGGSPRTPDRWFHPFEFDPFGVMVATDEPGARFAAPPAIHIRPLRGRGERRPGARRGQPQFEHAFPIRSRKGAVRSLRQTLNVARAWLNRGPRPDFVLCIAPGIRHNAAPKPTMNTPSKPVTAAPHARSTQNKGLQRPQRTQEQDQSITSAWRATADPLRVYMIDRNHRD